MRCLIQAGLTLTGITMLTGCGTVYQANSPDIAYSSESVSSRTLQIPPDLTDVSNGEQFILPGNTGGSVSRNTLLPSFDTLRYVRDGEQSWLEIDQQPEDIWPRLLEFVRQQKYRVEQTEPVTGVIATDWRSAAGTSGGLLKSLIGADEASTRIAFRLERNGSGTRLFARSQAASAEVAEASADAEWPASSHAPEATSELLSRLLVFFGVDEQRSKGILTEGQASGLMQKAELQTTAAGSQLILHRGYLPSFRAVSAALGTLDYEVSNNDDNVGRIEAGNASLPLMIVLLTPIHVSAVSVSLQDKEGRRLPEEIERAVLSALRAELV